MKKNKICSRGQNLLEISVLLVLLVTAFTAMQSYLKRGVQGKVKDLTDVLVGKDQLPYVAESATSTSTNKLTGTTIMATAAGGSVTKTIDDHGVMSSSSTSTGK